MDIIYNCYTNLIGSLQLHVTCQAKWTTKIKNDGGSIELAHILVFSFTQIFRKSADTSADSIMGPSVLESVREVW